MDRRAWWATVRGVTESWTWPSDSLSPFCFRPSGLYKRQISAAFILKISSYFDESATPLLSFSSLSCIPSTVMSVYSRTVSNRLWLWKHKLATEYFSPPITLQASWDVSPILLQVWFLVKSALWIFSKLQTPGSCALKILIRSIWIEFGLLHLKSTQNYSHECCTKDF